LLQFFSQVAVFIDELLPLGVYKTIHFDRLSDHGSDYAKKFHGAVVVSICFEEKINTQSSNRSVIDRYGDANECDLVSRRYKTLRCSVQKERLATDLGNHARFPAFHNPSSNPLSQAISHAMRVGAQPVRRFNVELVGSFLEESYRTSNRAVMIVQDLQ